MTQLTYNGHTPTQGLGLMNIAGPYGKPPNREEQFKLLDRALELGNTFWDTSNIYGDSEEMLGEWFKRTSKRNEIFLASKFGLIMEGTKFLGLDSSGDYCKKACEESLQKLGIGYLDLYYPHRLNPKTPIEETMQALAELKEQGKIKHIGLCEVSSNTLRRAVKIAPVAAVQIEYSPFSLDIERDSGTNLLKTCRELGVAVVCYAPLSRGLLTGGLASLDSIKTEGDIRNKLLPRFSDENFEANLQIVKGLQKMAEAKNLTVAQLVLAWIHKQGDDLIPIPGTRSIERMEENWAARQVHLTDSDEAEIRRFLGGIKVHGTRETAAGAAVAFVNTVELQ